MKNKKIYIVFFGVLLMCIVTIWLYVNWFDVHYTYEESENSETIKRISNAVEKNSIDFELGYVDSPKTALEQQRNLMLATGNMSQTVQEGIKSTTDAIDSMLNTLEQMTR